MDFFLILQILFDTVLLFGILFLFHFSVNQQQKKKEEFDIVKNIQVQEVKENLENLLFAMKQLGKDVSDDIQKKINESEEKTKFLNQNIKKLENQLNSILEFAEEIGEKKSKLKDRIKLIRSALKKKEELLSNDKSTNKTAALVEKKTKNLISRTAYSIGFSSEIVNQVYKLVDDNKDVGEVVKTTKLTRAEINLILNLRENRFTAPN